MEPCYTEQMTDEYFEVMKKVHDLFVDNNIGTRHEVAILAQMVFHIYKQCTTREVYEQYLDQCKGYWDMEE